VHAHQALDVAGLAQDLRRHRSVDAILHTDVDLRLELVAGRNLGGLLQGGLSDVEEHPVVERVDREVEPLRVRAGLYLAEQRRDADPARRDRLHEAAAEDDHDQNDDADHAESRVHSLPPFGIQR
jgi:hypothetical protein